MNYHSIRVEVRDSIGLILLNRPDKLNSLTMRFFHELSTASSELEKNENVVTIIITGEGKAFSSGLDFNDFLKHYEENKQGKREEDFLYNQIVFMQNSISSIANSRKVYIAAIHGYCFGGGLDLASTCDIRVASEDTLFSIMETRMGIVADLGSIQRLPRIIGESNTRLLAYTSMKIDSKTALSMGLVSRIFRNREETLKGAFDIAYKIASNPKEAVFGTKIALNYGMSSTVEDALGFAAEYNAKLFDYREIKKRFLSNLRKTRKNKPIG